jgi:glycosyltransferase involved in cell wall biosynthesis
VPFINWNVIADHYGIRNEIPINWIKAYPKLNKYDFAWKSVRWAQSWESDLIYTRLPQAAAISSSMGLNTILETHDQPKGRIGPIAMRLFLKGKGARRVVVISHALAADLAKLINGFPVSPFTLIAPDGVDLVRYVDLPSPVEARMLLSPWLEDLARRVGGEYSSSVFTVGYTGHLYPGRGINLILDLAERLPNINFLIVGGETNDYEELVARVNSRNLRNLIPVGFVPNAELPLFQASCEVLLMPYQRRVAASSGGDIAQYLSPMKLFEYLASGRVICSSDLPVLREILTEKNAILLPPENLIAWVNALEKIQHDLEFRYSLSVAARDTALLYTWQERVKKILSYPPELSK